MFGFKTIVVGNMPNTKLAAAITAASEQDGNKINHTEIVRVYEWAWLGDWIGQVLPIMEALHNNPDVAYKQLTGDLPTVQHEDYLGVLRDYPVIAGAERPENFYLLLGDALDLNEITRASCADTAARSLVKDDEDELELVYGVILNEETYTKKNSELMLRALRENQSFISDANMRFKIRVFVVKDDGSVEMHKL